MTGLSAVLCDVDGVLRHWDQDAVAALEAEHGLPAGTIARTAFAPERLLPAVTGRVTDEAWRAGVAEALADPCGSRERAAALVARWSAPMGRLDEEVLDLLKRARCRAVPLALVSNATTRLERDLAALGLTPALDAAVVNSARVGVAKPDAGIYLAAAELVGVPPDRCLFVDDTPVNVAGAQAVGMTGLLYRAPQDLRDALGRVGA
jgi:putative hydrolase of the HAD superfamily